GHPDPTAWHRSCGRPHSSRHRSAGQRRQAWHSTGPRPPPAPWQPVGWPARWYERESARCDVSDHSPPATAWGGRGPCAWLVDLVVMAGGFLWSAEPFARLVTVPRGVTQPYAIPVIAFRKRSNEPANITAPIRARARKGFQTVSSPAPR